MKLKIKPPCQGCTDRKGACHASCMAYQEWLIEHKKDREKFYRSISGELEERRYRHERHRD